MDLVDFVYDVLSPLNMPVLWQLRPNAFPGLTYHFFNEQGELYGDGKEKTGSVLCQVDVWSKDNYGAIKKQVKTNMKEAGFLYVSATDTYEDDVRLYHCVLVFNYYFEDERDEREVKE